MLKKSLLLLALGFSFTAGNAAFAADTTPATTAPAAKFKWYTDLASAQAAAAAQHKPVVVLLSNPSWCHFCVQLEKEHVNTAAFKAWGADKAIFVKLDKYPRGKAGTPDEKKAYAFGQKYGVSGVPAFISLDADGKKIGSGSYAKGPTAEYLKTLGESLKLDAK